MASNSGNIQQQYDAAFAAQNPSDAAYYAANSESPYFIYLSQLAQGGAAQPLPGIPNTAGPQLPSPETLLGSTPPVVIVPPVTIAAPFKNIRPLDTGGGDGGIGLPFPIPTGGTGDIYSGYGGGISLQFPDPKTIVAGKVVDLSGYNGNQPLFFNVPTIGNFAQYTAGAIWWYITNVGWQVFLGAIKQYTTTTPSSSQSSTSGIEDTINIVNNINDNISGDINSAISAETNVIRDTLGGVTNAVVSGVEALGTQLGDFVNSAFGDIGNVLKGIGTSIVTGLGNVLGAIFNGIGAALGAIKDVLASLVNAIASKFDALIAAIKANGASALIPIIQLIATEAYNIRNIISAIELDIHGGVLALLLLPTQISTSLGSLDASLQRAMQQLGITSMPTVNTTVQTAPGTSLDNLINSFAATIGTGLPPTGPLEMPIDFVSLVNTCKHVSSAEAFLKLGAVIQEAPPWIQWLPRMILGLVSVSTTIVAYLQKQVELTEEDVNKACPIKKFDPATATEAWLRKFIDDATLSEELGVQGYDANHITVLKKLVSQRLDTGTLLDASYRGIIDDSGLSSGLSTLGYTPDEISVLKAESTALPAIADVLRWWSYQAINQIDRDKFLTKLRVPPDQQQNIINSFQTDVSVEQLIQLNGRLQAFGAGMMPISSAYPLSQPMLDAAQREQLKPGVAQALWQAHWQVPAWQLVQQMMWRQMATPNDLKNALVAENIPEEFFDALTRINQPLLPFRSIPGYVKAGVLSEGDAIVELAAHGFDPLHIKWILDYVSKSTKSTVATAVGGVASLSVATARGLFDDGAITQDQYIQVLEAHKFPPDVALLQAEADVSSFHAKQRKQTLTDFIDEVAAGVLTIDDALSQLHLHGYTMAEIAKFQKAVRKSTVASIKHPSISEMEKFLKAQLITLDQFKTELASQGWGTPWLEAFVALETPPTA